MAESGTFSRLSGLIRQYKYALLIFMMGVLLMMLPQPEEKGQEPAAPELREEEPGLQEALEEILSQVEGAGQVRVLLSLRRGEETLYQADEDISSDSRQTDTLVISGTDREEGGLVRRVDPPEYLAALVLCQGGQDPAVRLAITQAVANLTGLPTNKVTVLIMEG